MESKELFRRVCDVLIHADRQQGMRLSKAIQEAKGGVPATYAEKNYVRDRLGGLAKGSVYFWYEGKKFYPGDKIERKRGKSDAWVLLEKPPELSPERQALVISTIKRHAAYLLPPWERKVLNKLLNERSLSKQNPAWLNRIDVVPRYPPLYPNLDDDYEAKEETLLRALEQTKGFRASYLGGDWNAYFPLKLTRREAVSYIVCYCQETRDFREYAIHRFKLNRLDGVTAPPLLDRPRGIPATFKLSMLTSNVSGQWGMLKTLRLRISGPPAQHLSEVRFHADKAKQSQTKVINSGGEPGQRLDWVELEIREVNYDYTFKTWLLGLGGYLKILSFEAEHDSIDPIRDLKQDVKALADNLMCTV